MTARWWAPAVLRAYESVLASTAVGGYADASSGNDAADGCRSVADAVEAIAVDRRPRGRHVGGVGGQPVPGPQFGVTTRTRKRERGGGESGRALRVDVVAAGQRR